MMASNYGSRMVKWYAKKREAIRKSERLKRLFDILQKVNNSYLEW